MLNRKLISGHLAFALNFATIILIPILLLPLVTYSSEISEIALPNCPDKCGNVSIPYPFGIGDNCHYSHSDYGRFYNIICNESKVPIVPTYGNGIEVVNITLDGHELWVKNYISTDCYNNTGQNTYNFTSWIRISLFALSATKNIAGGVGCDTLAFFSGTRMNTSATFQNGCVTGCDNQSDVGNTCSGIGCCLTSIPDGITNITLDVRSVYKQSMVQYFNPCSVAFLAAKNHLNNETMPFSIQSVLNTNFNASSVISLPIVYDWSIGKNNCEAAKEYICKGNSSCFNPTAGEWGYRCMCNHGFEGNPYHQGCQDIDECANSDNKCEKQEYCVNKAGDYSCECPKGYYGDGTKDNPCKSNSANSNPKKWLLAIIIILCVSGGIIVSLITAFGFYWQHGNKKLRKQRDTFFDQNGGKILNNVITIFTPEELKNATNNYSEECIIGRGGFGMVYKGILPNNQIIAIKKSLRVDPTQVGQFTNEIKALSEIKNIHVVKLLGCCLESEVPLLVYEFISNGTLYEHLHDEGNKGFLNWDVRLRIAAQVAQVLAYLHTKISIPIIHRDIKSANILLDDKCTAKVADFGASKLAPVDREQLATMVQGTCGYLDPEYMQTGELTDKSDVYSFGVVLVELLTREKAISYEKPEKDRSLAIYFLRKIKEDRLFEILDHKIVSDDTIEQLKEVGNLAKRCLKLKGEDRPTMEEVEMELYRIKGMRLVHPWSNNEVQLQEEGEYLLGETREINNTSFGGEPMNSNDHMYNQSQVVQLVALNDGR